MNHNEMDTYGTSKDADCRLSAAQTANDHSSGSGLSRGKEGAVNNRQDQTQTTVMPDLAAGSRLTDITDGKQATAGKPVADASHNRDHHQPRDVAPSAAAAAGHSAFAAAASSYQEPSTTPAGSDAGSFMRQQLRGVEAMMGGQRRTHSGALTSPSGLSDHDGLLMERAASSSSTHRALLGGSSPERPAVQTGGLLDHPERSSSDGNTRTAADCAPAGDALQQAGTNATAGESRRSSGVARPTVVIPSPPAAVSYFVPMQSPSSGLVQAYPGGTIPIDEIDLDVIDDIAGVDACGLSNSSSPTISGAVVGRITPGGHLRTSRDNHDLRRAALMNMQLLSPSMQQGAHISAAGVTADLSISAGGPMPSPAMMFTGPTRERAHPGSNNSLQSVGSGAEQYPITEPMDALQMLQTLRMSASSTPSPAYNGSPARPPSRSAAATPRTGMGGGSRTSSAAGSPVPPASHGPAAALLSGNVVPSPRTPHSPLSVILSPRPGSVRTLSGQGTPLPGPLFGSGFNVVPVGTSPGTSPASSSVAAASSTVSSCCTGSGAGAPVGVQPPAAAGGHSRFRSPTPTAGAGADAQQQQSEAVQQQPTHLQLLRQQVLSHDTRYGPHGGSPLSPSHHHQQLPPRAGADVLLSPTCPTSLVPPALTSAGSHNRLVAESAAAGAAPTPGAAASSRSVGGVGQLSIHEWLDHQSRMLPYEVPQGLRDAADLREAVAQEQQHLQSRMGPGRGPYSQRSSLSNLDSPGALLHGPGASTGSGRFPAAAGGQVHAGVPVHPALHTLQEQCPQQGHSYMAQHVHDHGSQAETPYGQLSITLSEDRWGATAATQQHSNIWAPTHAQGTPLLTEAQSASVVSACPHADPGQGHLHQGQPLSSRDGTGSSSLGSRPTVVQLGAGSHTYTAGSPVQQGSCYSCQNSGGDGQQGHACAGTTTEPVARSFAVSSSSLDGCGANSHIQAAGRVLCAPLDVREYQQPAAPLTWRQLQVQQLVSPTGRSADASARVSRQQVHLDQHVLPGIAELLHRRHGQQQHSLATDDGHTADAPSGRCSIAGRLHAESQPAAACLIKGHTIAAVPGAAVAHAAVCNAAADPADGVAAVRSSRDGCTASWHTVAAASQTGACDGGGGSSHGGSDVTLAELLLDDGFVGGILSDLPGVNPQSDIVWATVAELQQALSAERGTAAQQRMQLP